MRKFLGTVAMVVIGIAVVGGLRQWFSVERIADGENTEVHLFIHREKIRIDTQNVRDVARELGENLHAKVEQRLGDRRQATGDRPEAEGGRPEGIRN